MKTRVLEILGIDCNHRCLSSFIQIDLPPLHTQRYRKKLSVENTSCVPWTSDGFFCCRLVRIETNLPVCCCADALWLLRRWALRTLSTFLLWRENDKASIYGLYTSHDQVSSVQSHEGNVYFPRWRGFLRAVTALLLLLQLLYVNKTRKTEHSGFDLRRFKGCHGGSNSLTETITSLRGRCTKLLGAPGSGKSVSQSIFVQTDKLTVRRRKNEGHRS